jgi:capsular polysaccharide biosynthesis protein
MATTTEFTPPRADRLNGSAEQAPPLTPFQAVVAHPLLALLPIVLMVAGAVAFGLSREPAWTSEARLNVGELTPSTQSAPGIVEANQQLASAFSRAIDARRVVTPVARELGLTSSEVERRLDASAIPESPVLTVSGTGPTERDAVAITSVGTSALVRYIRRLGDRAREERRLLRELTAARRELAELREEVVLTGPNPDLNAAQLRAKALETQYLELTRQPGSTPVTALNPAETATSDRQKVLKLAIVIAALAGIAVGAGLATVREARLRQRVASAF